MSAESPPGQRRCPTCGGEAPADRWAAMESIVPSIDSFRRRIVADAVNQQRVQWWLARAEDFERAKPRSGDFCGQASPEVMRARWRWCDETARACRTKAEFLRLCGDDLDARLDELLGRRSGVVGGADRD